MPPQAGERYGQKRLLPAFDTVLCEPLSEKDLERVSTLNLWVYYGQEIVLLPRFADSQSLNLRLVQTLRTVSLGNRLSKGAGLLGD